MLTNDEIIKLALDAGLLNYIDNETPRRYFIYSWQENLMIFSRQDELPANRLAFLYTV